MNWPTPRDTFAQIADRNRKMRLDAAKIEVSRLAKERGYHHPDTNAELERLGRLLRQETAT